MLFRSPISATKIEDEYLQKLSIMHIIFENDFSVDEKTLNSLIEFLRKARTFINQNSKNDNLELRVGTTKQGKYILYISDNKLDTKKKSFIRRAQCRKKTPSGGDANKKNEFFAKIISKIEEFPKFNKQIFQQANEAIAKTINAEGLAAIISALQNLIRKIKLQPQSNINSSRSGRTNNAIQRGASTNPFDEDTAIIEAPTNEIAIGIKSKDFGIDSCLVRSNITASKSPSTAVKIGTTITHKIVLIIMIFTFGSV